MNDKYRKALLDIVKEKTGADDRLFNIPDVYDAISFQFYEEAKVLPGNER